MPATLEAAAVVAILVVPGFVGFYVTRELTALPIRDRLVSAQVGGGVTETALRRAGFGPDDLDQPMSKVAHPSHILITVAGANAGKRTGVYPGLVGRMDPERMGAFVPVSAKVEPS